MVVFADMEAVLQAFPADKQQEALQQIQTRITNVMFVELLFEKGPREAEMINREYNWQPAVQRKMAELGYRDRAPEGAALVCQCAVPQLKCIRDRVPNFCLLPSLAG